MFLDNSIVLTHSDKVRILSEIKTLVKENKFEINLNTSSREENSYFVFQCDLEDKDIQKNILLNLSIEEFKDSGYSKNENLYSPVSLDIIKSHYQYYFNSFKQDNFSNNNLDFIGYYAKKVSQIVKTLF